MVRYARGIDRYDIELAKSAYHPDATDEHGPIRGNAHEVMDRVEKSMADIEVCQHLMATNPALVEGYRQLVERIRPYGMRLFQQLWHGVNCVQLALECEPRCPRMGA